MRIAIIKADDLKFKGNYKSWDKFVETGIKRGIKISIGLICNTPHMLDQSDYHNYLRNYDSTKNVEFWNHGWNHVTYKNDDFNTQKYNIEMAQTFSKGVFGVPFSTFGFPGNGYNEASAEVLNEIPDIKAVFFRQMIDRPFQDYFKKILIHNGPKVSNKDYNYLANFSFFKKDYKYRFPVEVANQTMSVEFHPNFHDDKSVKETEMIFDFLIDRGWKFMLPREYIKLKESGNIGS